MTRRNAWSSAVFGSGPALRRSGAHSVRAYNVPTRASSWGRQVSRALQFGTIRRLPSGRYQPATGTSASRCQPARPSRRRRTLEPGSPRSRPISGVAITSTPERVPSDSAITPGAVSTTATFGHELAETYESQLEWILNTFESVRLREIDAASVRSWYGRMHKAGRSSNTVAKVYRLFRTIMSTAVDDGLLRSNPVSITLKRGSVAARPDDARSLSVGRLPTVTDAVPRCSPGPASAAQPSADCASGGAESAETRA